MKTLKTTLLLSFALAASLAARATVLFDDATNYPYTDGPIEGQGQWYSYSPLTSPADNVFVTNNVLLLVTSTTNDAVAAPTNGWVNPNPLTYASFRINVSQLPASTNGGYFCQLENKNDSNDCCHIFIDTRYTVVPGTYRLGVANFATSFSSLTPPVNYPMDLATNTWYTVVVAFGNAAAPSEYQGGTLFINPSEADNANFLGDADIDDSGDFGYVYGVDTTSSTNLLLINITQIGFSPFIYAGISNVLAGTTFDDVDSTNLPVFGIQPQSATGYSGNPTTLYAVASGVDVTYQWYSTTSGKLSDNASYTGSRSDALTVNFLTASDNYYCVATDAYGNTTTSATASETVITTLTAPFFPTNVVVVTNTANLFTTTGFTNVALGTGPLYYQWYFAPTNTPNTYSPLAGQNNPVLSLFLADYTTEGNYYLVVSNSVGGGSIAVGPTNTLVELAPLIATMLQLHNLEVSFASQIAANSGGTVNINTNNVTVNGYVSVFGNLPQASGQNSEYFMQDASGLGIEVFFPANGNTNVPAVGANITVSGPIKVFDSTIEVVANSGAAITTNTVNVPPVAFTPPVDNAIFADLSYNGLGNNGLLYQGSLVTFTNCYVYGSRTGGALPNGGLFASNSFVNLYVTINGPYSASNTNTLNVFQPAYNLGTATTIFKYNPFDLKPIPSYCYQITGIYDEFKGAGEIIPTRLEDYVTTPPSFTTSIAQAKAVSTVTWQPQVGSTYSIYGATSLLGPWTQEAYGLAYFPTNGTFSETNHVPYKFYKVGSP